MKILYGVVGEGMGHAIRSSVILDHLIAQGHEVHIVVSGNAHSFLKKRFPQVSQIWGLTMAMEDNEVKNRLTLAKNLAGALTGFPKNIQQYFDIEASFAPDVVISDFESWSWLFARRHDIPLICIDNIQIINRCKHSADIIGHDRPEFKLTRSIVKAKCPGADHYFITTFFRPPVRKKRTTLVHPILRPSILEAAPESSDHLLVYQSSESNEHLPATLKKLDRPVLVYGMRRDIDAPITDKNLTYKPFSEDGFIHDLATSHAVIASAGFTLMGEALHLKKPYLATPIRKQFEQIMNARYLEQLGYGTYDTHLDRHTIEHFLERHDEFSARLADYPSADNSELFGLLDEALDRAVSDML